MRFCDGYQLKFREIILFAAKSSLVNINATSTKTMAAMIYKKITVGCRVTHTFTDGKDYKGVVVQRSKEHVDVIFDDGDEETDLDVREVRRIPQRMQEGKIHDEAKPFWEKYQPDKGSSSSSRRVKKKSKKELASARKKTGKSPRKPVVKKTAKRKVSQKKNSHSCEKTQIGRGNLHAAAS